MPMMTLVQWETSSISQRQLLQLHRDYPIRATTEQNLRQLRGLH